VLKILWQPLETSLGERSGFAELTVRDWRGALAIGGRMTPAEAAEFASAAFSSYGELRAAAGSGARNEVRGGLTTCFSEHQRDGVVHMDACVHIVTGIRPR
jgi:hypothetical protein